MSDVQFNIKGTSISATKLSTSARHFNVVVDEPDSFGGTDDAPNPVEYILIGLAGCLNVVAHTVANEIDVKIESLNIEISGGLNPNKFLGVSDDERAGFKGIDVNLILKTDGNKLQVNNLLEQINKRCPVKDNLLSATPVNLSINANQLAEVE